MDKKRSFLKTYIISQMFLVFFAMPLAILGQKLEETFHKFRKNAGNRG